MTVRCKQYLIICSFSQENILIDLFVYDVYGHLRKGDRYTRLHKKDLNDVETVESNFEHLGDGQ